MHDCYNSRFYGKNGIIELTQIENIILDILLNPKGYMITLGELCSRIYISQKDESYNNCIRKHIYKLRKKLENEITIVTMYGLGYKIR